MPATGRASARAFMTDLIVVGRPKSLQSNTAHWQRTVRNSAQSALGPSPAFTTGPVHAGFHWFCDFRAPRAPDLDNVLKPTFDALTGLAFADDDQISDIRATRIDLNSLPLRGASAADYGSWPAKLAEHLLSTSGPEEFVYIQVTDPPHPLEAAWIPRY